MHRLHSLSLSKKLLMIALVGVALGTWGVEFTHEGPTEPIALVFGALPLLLAVLLVNNEKWVLITTLLLAAFYLIGAVTTQGELNNLLNPPTIWAFVAISIEILSCLIVLVSGGFELVKSRRPATQS